MSCRTGSRDAERWDGREPRLDRCSGPAAKPAVLRRAPFLWPRPAVQLLGNSSRIQHSSLSHSVPFSLPLRPFLPSFPWDPCVPDFNSSFHSFGPSQLPSPTHDTSSNGLTSLTYFKRQLCDLQSMRNDENGIMLNLKITIKSCR